jgi:hypothetical protein
MRRENDNEWWIGKDLDGSARGLLEWIILEFALELRATTKSPTEISIWAPVQCSREPGNLLYASWGVRFSRQRVWRWLVFWDVAACSLVEIYRRFRGAYFLHRPDDGGSKHLWNVGLFLPDCLAQHPRRQSSSAVSFQTTYTCYLADSYTSTGCFFSIADSHRGSYALPAKSDRVVTRKFASRLRCLENTLYKVVRALCWLCFWSCLLLGATD